jgi:predicted kinase
LLENILISQIYLFISLTKLKQSINHLLQNRQKLLIDNTGVSKESRKAYLNSAKGLNKSAGVIFLDTALEKCMERNQSREEIIPDTVITNLSLSAELPERDEGFQAILVVEDY